jgi:hypothetical protein
MLRRRRLPVMLSGGGVRCPEWTITDRGSVRSLLEVLAMQYVGSKSRQAPVAGKAKESSAG